MICVCFNNIKWINACYSTPKQTMCSRLLHCDHDVTCLPAYEDLCVLWCQLYSVSKRCSAATFPPVSAAQGGSCDVGKWLGEGTGCWNIAAWKVLLPRTENIETTCPASRVFWVNEIKMDLAKIKALLVRKEEELCGETLQYYWWKGKRKPNTLKHGIMGCQTLTLMCK